MKTSLVDSANNISECLKKQILGTKWTRNQFSPKKANL